jgi:hypothetical protein
MNEVSTLVGAALPVFSSDPGDRLRQPAQGDDKPRTAIHTMPGA